MFALFLSLGIVICFCQLDRNLNTSGEREPQLAIDSIGVACGNVCGGFSWLLIDVGGPSPLWANRSELYKDVSPAWAKESKPESNIPAWSLLQFLPLGSSMAFLGHGL